MDEFYYYYQFEKSIKNAIKETELKFNIVITNGEFYANEIKHNGKVLVASGEQSFLYLYLKGFLPKGRFQTVTPCFRYESFDFLHTKYFIKNELIDTANVSDKNLQNIIEVCLDFFQKYLPESKAVKTDFGWDIEWMGYELGSYGIRSCEFLDWIYATGVAEPRFSSLINLKK
jgi:hypothetical protein